MLALTGVILGLLIIIALVRIKIDYGIAMVIGALTVAITSQLTPTQLIESTINTLRDPSTIDLIVLVIFINMIGVGMKETGQIDRVLDGFRSLMSRRGTVGAIPAIFGLLPMPGGALMSAPVMEPEADKLGSTNEEKTVINFWFRHFFFFIFPFSPDLVLAARLGEVSIYQLILIQIPVAIIALILGYIFYIRPLKKGDIEGNKGYYNGTWTVIYGLAPILIAIALYGVTGISLRYFVPLAFLLLIIQNIQRLKPKKTIKIMKEGFPPNLVLAVFGIMFFREILTETGSLEIIVDISRAIGIPIELIVLLIPFIIAMVTGIGMAAIGISFPLIIPFIPELQPIHISILFVSCFLGYLASPVHLCLVVTTEYFNSDLIKNLKQIAKPISILLIYNLILVLIFL
ncbi:Tripartite tricarboxylate transporter (TTT) class transporter [Methanonatronarchaeum thermophilum]|uniref:Tripartite tricarboxylate transporter (TTT) class transporter n=1 Tax=Methanonatronarchaeum thermophilum TaxID=1927129 RepID=A0A1Y3GFI0_9EURY|nr:DUF401 family protein [Methanonatronarchaeum thermophilum]OUJ18215.1 Tripartite tricarboxylate transporter (TTT) class transporter [Methanonatronarchaeum thermophilum]